MTDKPSCDFLLAPQGDIGNIRPLDEDPVSHPPYQPVRLPPNSLDSSQFIHLASDVSVELTKYNSLLSLLPNPEIILRCLQNEEAVLSSRMAGTQATFNEVMAHYAGKEAESEIKRDDVQEITNYREALSYGREALNRGYTINLTLVRELHRMLMQGARGANKAPGEIRKVQNCVGPHTPPEAGQLPLHMNDWLAYLNNDEQEPLIQAALMHAQFELLYPFLDGNGRLGRLLITLFLWQKKRTTGPVFYLSAYLESNCDTYYQKLRNISEHGDWAGWVRFFLGAMAAQAKTNCEKIIKIKLLHEEMKGKFQKIIHSKLALTVLDATFASPYFRPAQFTNFGVPQLTANRLLKKLEHNDILVSINVTPRIKFYIFPRLLTALQNK